MSITIEVAGWGSIQGVPCLSYDQKCGFIVHKLEKCFKFTTIGAITITDVTIK